MVEQMLGQWQDKILKNISSIVFELEFQISKLFPSLKNVNFYSIHHPPHFENNCPLSVPQTTPVSIVLKYVVLLILFYRMSSYLFNLSYVRLHKLCLNFDHTQF